MAKTQAHSHHYDLHTNTFGEVRAACTVCGFSVPLDSLCSRVNLDAITARKNATQKLRDRLNCSECNGSGKLETLGGDWGKIPEGGVTCWMCNGSGIRVDAFQRIGAVQDGEL